MGYFFGQNLKALRVGNKLSQVELGRQMFKGQKTVGNWETGYSEPSLEELVRISEIFDTSIDSLLKHEISVSNPNDKVHRNRSKDDCTPTESFALHTAHIKERFQAKPVHEDDTKSEIAWRNKYISFLEEQLQEKAANSFSENSLQNLMIRVIELQKTITELSLAQD